MGLKTVVKVSHITDLATARYCAGIGVDMIGFCLDDYSADFLQAKTAQEIASWVAGVQIVGEISSATPVHISDYPLSMLELNSAVLLKKFVEEDALHSNAPLIYRFSIDNLETLALCYEALSEQVPNVVYFLLESSLLKIDAQVSSLLAKLCNEYPILLGFGITQDNILTILEQIKPKGIAIRGTIDSLAAILEQIEIEDNIEM
ncbi:MAG: hypothetical protein EAZ08_07410 [Cytophagales bacterium]|nr:MAG: hypothetical protein EAZ08_07410 [Cytophagales bacterium]